MLDFAAMSLMLPGSVTNSLLSEVRFEVLVSMARKA